VIQTVHRGLSTVIQTVQRDPDGPHLRHVDERKHAHRDVRGDVSADVIVQRPAAHSVNIFGESTCDRSLRARDISARNGYPGPEPLPGYTVNSRVGLLG